LAEFRKSEAPAGFEPVHCPVGEKVNTEPLTTKLLAVGKDVHADMNLLTKPLTEKEEPDENHTTTTMRLTVH
jgi:hypothetical protein